MTPKDTSSAELATVPVRLTPSVHEALTGLQLRVQATLGQRLTLSDVVGLAVGNYAMQDAPRAAGAPQEGGK